MKKMMVFILICLNVALFSLVLDVHKEQSLADVLLLFNFKEDKVSESVLFYSTSNEEVDLEEFVSDMYSISLDHEVMIAYEDLNYEDNTYDYYIAYHHSLKEALNLVVDESIIFNGNSNKYYSTYGGGEQFYLLDDSLMVTFQELGSTVVFPESITIYASSSEDLNNTLTDIEETYGSIISETIQYTQGTLDSDGMIQEAMFLPLLFGLFLTAIVLFTYISRNGKTIGVMKLHGYSNVTIFQELVVPIIGLTILCVPSTLFLLSLLQVGTINSVTISFYKDLFYWGSIEILLVTALLVTSVLVLGLTTHSFMLKGKNHLKVFLSIDAFIKIACIVLLYPSLMNAYSSFTLSLTQLNKVEEMSLEASSYEYINGLQTSLVNDGYDIALYYQEFYSNFGKTVTYDDPFYDYQEAYENLNSEGAIYFELSTLVLQNIGEIPLYSINYNYVDAYPFYDMNGEEIEFTKFSEDVVVLVSAQYEDSDIEDSISTESPITNTIVVSNLEQQPIFNSFNQYNEDGVFIVYMDEAFRLDKSPLFDMYYMGDIESIVGDYFEGKVQINTLDKNIEYYQFTIKSMLKESYIVFSIMFFILLITAIQYSYLYHQINKRVIAVKRIHGYSFIDIYKDLLLQELLLFTLLVLITKYLGFHVLGIFLLLGIDVFIIYLSITYIDKRTISSLLKGEQ